VLSLCSDDAFGLAGHPRVQAAGDADARRLEGRLAEYHGVATVRVHGSAQLARLSAGPGVQVHSLEGALCSQGAYVTCSPRAAGPYVFAATPAPAAMGRAVAALEVLMDEPWRAERLTANARFLRAALAAEGFDVERSGPHVVPLVVADALTTAASARVEGVLVERGSAEIRLSVTVLHTRTELSRAAAVLGRAAPRRALPHAA
jgi:7-keto-8-aminopelargonate synthetase-like enzyme